MSKNMPPAPPAGRSDKGPGGSPDASADGGGSDRGIPSNPKEQDRQGDIMQNTTHQGYQQDR